MKTGIGTRVGSAVHYVVRSEGRLRARFATRLQRDGEPDCAFTLRNISPSGFMGELAEAAEPLRAGGKVTLLLPFGGSAEADIRWAIGRRIGCQLRAKLTRRQRTLVLGVAAKNAALSPAGLQAAMVAALVGWYLLR